MLFGEFVVLSFERLVEPDVCDTDDGPVHEEGRRCDRDQPVQYGNATSCNFQSVRFGRSCGKEMFTAQADICQHHTNDCCEGQSQSRATLAVTFTEHFWDKALYGHGPEHAGRQID